MTSLDQVLVGDKKRDLATERKKQDVLNQPTNQLTDQPISLFREYGNMET